MKEELKKSKDKEDFIDIVYPTSPHSFLIGVVWVIIIIYLGVGISGLINLSKSELLKNFSIIYWMLFLFGLIVPFELLAIYYKLK